MRGLGYYKNGDGSVGEVWFRGLPKENGNMGEVPVGGGFAFLREGRGR